MPTGGHTHPLRLTEDLRGDGAARRLARHAQAFALADQLPQHRKALADEDGRLWLRLRPGGCLVVLFLQEKAGQKSNWTN